jgi:hypothetical protein
MMSQIEFLINNSQKRTNEKITNLINNEYIEWSFLFNKIFMEKLFYIFTIGKIRIVKDVII